MPEPEETVAAGGSHVNVHCKAGDSPIILVLNLSLSVVFMILCTVLAFKTRRFPKNYNEAKYIGMYSFFFYFYSNIDAENPRKIKNTLRITNSKNISR